MGRAERGRAGDLLMQLLQVRCQVVYALSIQELANDIGGLQIANGGHILCHGSIVVMLAV